MTAGKRNGGAKSSPETWLLVMSAPGRPTGPEGAAASKAEGWQAGGAAERGGREHRSCHSQHGGPTRPRSFVWVPLSEVLDMGCPQRHTVISGLATQKPCFLFGVEGEGAGALQVGQAPPEETTAAH